MLFADDDADEPFTLDEFSEFLDESGATVEKLNPEPKSRVIEVKFDNDFDDMDEFVSFEELVKYLQAEGILIKVTDDDNGQVIEVEFDHTIRDPENQPFTLEELADFLEDDGFTVEVVKSNGQVARVRIIFATADEGKDDKDSEEPTTTKRNDEKPIEKKKIDSTVGNEVKSGDRKIEAKLERNEDKFVVHDFMTRTDSMNKIRRRRSACPECKTGYKIKEFISRFDGAH